MPARFLQLWETLRSSYWFIPSLMSVGAIALALGVTALDNRVGAAWLEDVGWFAVNRPDGARAVLSTIAGSMITVAGVTFSITIAAVSFASGQFGPRILTNFLRDRGNQFTLGTFIATFLYCLLVLRTVRSPGEGEEAVGFVPHLSLLIGVALALCSIGVFIFFIHHVPDSMHISRVIAEVGRSLRRQIETRFPKKLGEGADDDAGAAAPPPGFPDFRTAPVCRVRARSEGYVQSVNEALLMETAAEHDLVLRLLYRPGDFVSRGRPLLEAVPPERVDAEVEERLQAAYAWGARRTPVQDVRFLVDELVEIAGRALSPGVNDPFTAFSCLDWLGAALGVMGGRALPSPYRCDADGRPRAVAHAMRFEDLAEGVFGQLRPYVSADRNAALHTFAVLGEVARDVPAAHNRAVLRRHADGLIEACELRLDDPATLADLRARHRQVLGLLRGDPEAVIPEEPYGWLGGTA